MADMMQFDLVSPERKLASIEASAVDIPGSEGDFTAMPDHAALITTLRPGVLRVTSVSDVSEFVVSGGFVEVSATSATVLAESAMPKDEATREVVEALIAAAEQQASEAGAEIQDIADKRLNDIKALLELLGV